MKLKFRFLRAKDGMLWWEANVPENHNLGFIPERVNYVQVCISRSEFWKTT